MATLHHICRSIQSLYHRPPPRMKPRKKPRRKHHRTVVDALAARMLVSPRLAAAAAPIVQGSASAQHHGHVYQAHHCGWGGRRRFGKPVCEGSRPPRAWSSRRKSLLRQQWLIPKPNWHVFILRCPIIACIRPIQERPPDPQTSSGR